MPGEIFIRGLVTRTVLDISGGQVHCFERLQNGKAREVRCLTWQWERWVSKAQFVGTEGTTSR